MDDVFSHGFICPKGSTLKQLHDDPDRLRMPMVKRDGVHVAVSWDEAWDEIAARLPDVIERHGREALGVYVGNPTAHSLSAMTFARALLTGLGTRTRFSASTVDQMPRHVAAGHVFGSPVADPGSRPRPHRPSRDPRCQPVRVERLGVYRSRLPGSPRGNPGSAVARSSSSTRAVRVRPSRPTSGSASGPVPMHCCSLRSRMC